MKVLHHLVGLAALSVFALGLGTFGCHSARFPVCESDTDCAKEKKAKLCYDLRCVECRYDGDCGDGYCERKTGTCERLDGAAPTDSSSDAPASSSAPADSATP